MTFQYPLSLTVEILARGQEVSTQDKRQVQYLAVQQVMGCRFFPISNRRSKMNNDQIDQCQYMYVLHPEMLLTIIKTFMNP